MLHFKIIHRSNIFINTDKNKFVYNYLFNSISLTQITFFVIMDVVKSTVIMALISRSIRFYQNTEIRKNRIVTYLALRKLRK